MFVFVFVFFNVGVHGYHRLPSIGILSICKTPKWLQGIENITVTSMDKVVCSKLISILGELSL